MFRVQSGSRADDALEALKAAIRLDPKDARAHYWMGKYYQGWGDVDQARQSFERARELDPSDPLIQLGLGQTMAADGEYAEALRLFRAAAAAQPGSVPALLGQARCIYGLGKVEEALAPAESAQRGALTFEDQSGAEWLLGRIYQDLGREADAQGARERLSKLQSGLDSDVVRLRELSDLAERYRSGGHPEKVVETMQQFLKIRETAGALVTLGDAYGALGRPAEAERCYLRAGQIGPMSDALRERLQLVRDRNPQNSRTPADGNAPFTPLKQHFR